MPDAAPSVHRQRRPEHGARRVLPRPSSSAGVTVAGLFFAASVTPSLYPRPWSTQAILSGVTAAAGYGLGTGAVALVRRLVSQSGPRRSATLLTILVGLLVPVWALVVNYSWQVDARALMGVEESAAFYPFAIVPVAAMTGYVVVVLSRLVAMGHDAYADFLSRLVPGRGRLLVRPVVPIVLLVFLLDVVVAGHAVSGIRDALMAADARSEAKILRPDHLVDPGGLAASSAGTPSAGWDDDSWHKART